jgi:hypothetical protein
MIIMFRSHNKLKLPLSLGTFFLFVLIPGCNQDPIFDYISQEAAPTEAAIKGSPSRIVEAGGKLYLANGRLWEYDLTGTSRSEIDGPGDYVKSVASTTVGNSSVLYALTMENTVSTGKVWKRNGTTWDPVAPPGGYPHILNFFGAGDILFATGAKRSGEDFTYAILYCKQSETAFSMSNVTPPIDKPPRLTGAGKVGNNYYLATSGKGIYQADDTNLSNIFEAPAYVREEDGKLKTDTDGNPILASVPTVMAGLLQTQDAQGQDIIIGVSREGTTVHIDSAGVLTVSSYTLGGTYTGALAMMNIPVQPDGSDRLLLLGYRSTNTSYSNGYMEVLLNSVDGTHEGNLRIPGENQPSSIEKEPQYTSSLRRYPVTALWVVDPAAPSVIFAATSNQGLYSYRERDGIWEWNHEE